MNALAFSTRPALSRCWLSSEMTLSRHSLTSCGTSSLGSVNRPRFIMKVRLLSRLCERLSSNSDAAGLHSVGKCPSATALPQVESFAGTVCKETTRRFVQNLRRSKGRCAMTIRADRARNCSKPFARIGFAQHDALGVIPQRDHGVVIGRWGLMRIELSHT